MDTVGVQIHPQVSIMISKNKTMSIKRHLGFPDGCDKSNPFIVPDGYFDHFPDKILSRIRKDETPVVRLRPYRRYIVAAACACALLLPLSGVFLWKQAHTPTAVSEHADEADAEQWMFAIDRATLMAALMDMEMPEDAIAETCCSEEQEKEIIRFLEQGNISIADIVSSMESEDFYY
jgi:hypothetical protein